MTAMIPSDEAARRLQVKVATLYAYVSRGLLSSYPSTDGRRRLFDADEVARFVRRGRSGKGVEQPFFIGESAITRISPDGPIYRGVPLGELIDRPYEDVFTLLVADGGGPWEPWPLRAPPKLLSRYDALRWALVMSAARDSLRFDLRPSMIPRISRRLVATFINVLPSAGSSGGVSRSSLSLAARLVSRLAAGAAAPHGERVINALLVGLADHGLASSTLAVRLAASANSNFYDSVLAGMGTMSGPLREIAAESLHRLFRDAEREDPEHAFIRCLRFRDQLPGFGSGQPAYGDRDPRVEMLLQLALELCPPTRRATIESVLSLAESYELPPPNLDLLMAAISFGFSLVADAGPIVLSIARLAGWTAHFLEELHERPLRFRATGEPISAVSIGDIV